MYGAPPTPPYYNAIRWCGWGYPHCLLTSAPLFFINMKTEESASGEKIHQDCADLERLLLPYTLLARYRTRYLRLRPVEIPTDKRGCHLVEITHLLDAIWDAADGLRIEGLTIPPIDPATHRE